MSRNNLDFDHPTGPQLRAARGLLNLSVKEVAERTGLVVNTIKRAESESGLSPTSRANARLLIRFFTDEGAVFVPADENAGPGVRLALGIEVTNQRRRRLTDD